MSRFRILDTPLAGLKVIERRQISDSRGFLSRIFCSEELRKAGWDTPIAQINHTLTRQPGTVRGLHYQRPPHSEIKLVSCLRGEIWDVAVDLRKDSPTFLSWFGQNLSSENGLAMLIPRGFAHGFQTLEDDCELLYLHSHAHCPESEGAVHPEDPRISVRWPSEITALSQRDSSIPFLSADYQGMDQ